MVAAATAAKALYSGKWVAPDVRKKAQAAWGEALR